MSPVYTERTQGTYRAAYVGCRTVTFDDKDNPGQEVTRWAWTFQDVTDPTTAGEISKLTGTSMASPQSNARKIAQGIIGRKLEPGDDTEAHIGEIFDVFWGPNQAGNLTIAAVSPVKAAQAVQEAPQAAQAVEVAPAGPLPNMVGPEPSTAVEDDLPF